MTDWANEIRERAREALPPVEGEIQVDGLREPVEVIRDRWGVPHIFATNFDDLIFAQGFVVASERLFQLDFMLRLANGRLCELVSEMGRGGIRKANDVAERRRILAGAINDVLEA